MGAVWFNDRVHALLPARERPFHLGRQVAPAAVVESFESSRAGGSLFRYISAGIQSAEQRRRRKGHACAKVAIVLLWLPQQSMTVALDVGQVGSSTYSAS